MVNQLKSTCQLRLEARSRAHKQSTAAVFAHAASSDDATSSSGSDDASNERLAAQMHSRIARADEKRVSKQRARETRARERVLHAQRVAREQHAKRREHRSNVCVASRAKVEIARQRRASQLEQLQQLCKLRVASVHEKVQLVKDKKRQKTEAARRVMQTQLLDAARRRDAQTQRRVARLTQRWQSVESVKDRVARVKFIQRWYRRHVDARKTAASLRAVAADVARVVACWQQIAARTFDASMLLVQDKRVARAAQSVLRVLLPSAATAATAAQRSPTARNSSSTSFRVLLLAGLLAIHPNELMATSGACPRLAFAASAIVTAMARIDALLSSSTSTAQALKTSVARLEAHFCFYFESFSTWKQRDAARLATEILASYTAIYSMKQRYIATAAASAAAGDVDGAHALAIETDKQLQQLQQALVQVIGKDATHERIAAVVLSVEQQQEQEHDVAMSSSTSDDNGESPAGEPTVAPMTPADVPHRSQLQPPPAQIASLLQNEPLVHELIVNPSFVLPGSIGSDKNDENPATLFAKRVRSTMVQAFWDNVLTANDVSTLLARTDELQSQFASVVSMQPALINVVAHALDRTQLAPLLAAPAAHVDALVQRCVRVLDAIRQAEAPARNDATDAFRLSWLQRVAALETVASPPTAPTRLFVDFVAFACDKLDVLQFDVARVHVDVLRTYLARHGVAFEQQQLAAQLAAGFEFPQTRVWLAAEMAVYWPTLDIDAQDRMARFETRAFAHFLRSSMYALVETYIANRSDAACWPETFRMDVDRIRGFRDTVDRIAVVASVLVVLLEYVTRRRLAAPRDWNARVATQLTALLESSGISGAHVVDRAVDEMRQLEVTRVSSAALDDLTRAELDALAQRLQLAFSATNPVFALFTARIAATVKAAALSDAATDNDALLDVHASLAPFATEIQTLARAFTRLAAHNERVHAVLYNSIVKELVGAM